MLRAICAYLRLPSSGLGRTRARSPDAVRGAGTSGQEPFAGVRCCTTAAAYGWVGCEPA